eukprot:GSChrysophyteH2.ASY1.ANO1.878.1 assembled CDS
MNLEGLENELLHVAFNQDSSCFACGTNDGFSVHNITPFKETFRRIFVSGGIGIVEMLYRCNLLAIVGGGSSPRYPPNKVMIWDDRQNRCVGELLFKTNVLAVHVHRFKDLKLLSQIVTASNPRGIVSTSRDNDVLAVLGSDVGTVRVELFNIGKFTTIKAHESDLAALTLNYDGTQLATASDKGTIIRLWDTSSGVQLREFRRGTDRAEIYSLAFNFNSSFLACSSDKGTVHVFSLQGTASGSGDGSAKRKASRKAANQQTSFQILPDAVVPSYFSSEWSYAQIRGVEGKSICAFEGQTDRICVLTELGVFTKCALPQESGDCPRLAINNFLRSDDTHVSSRQSAGAGAGASAFQPNGGTSSNVGGVGV